MDLWRFVGRERQTVLLSCYATKFLSTATHGRNMKASQKWRQRPACPHVEGIPELLKGDHLQIIQRATY